MNLPPEYAKNAGALPPVLHALLEAELAAGNSITEVIHSHPAPPVGACFMLARRVTTRARASGDGLSFYERNSSLYSGEFTDAQRCFFILEPPLPPPGEPDMDAIRTLVNTVPATNTAAATIEKLAAREPQTAPRGRTRKAPNSPQPRPTIVARPSAPLPADALQAERLHHFRDARPPHEVLFEIERDLMTLLQPSTESGRLVYRGALKVTGTTYAVRFTFEAALKKRYAYSLHFAVSWATMPATHHDYFRSSCVSWFNLWTRHFVESTPTTPTANVPARYESAMAAALAAEAELQTVEALQRAILAALRDGARYSTAHKEGGTTIAWQGGRFVRADYGESDKREVFADDAAFLEFLRRYFDYETSRNSHPEKVPELDAWRLMLRLLRRD
jgi:hypothetical protein